MRFPHARQLLVVQRHTTALDGTEPRTELAYAVTSLTTEQADPARLNQLLRGHWQIEAVHWVRDRVFAEDASRIRTAAGPQVMATLRNLALGLLRLAGRTATAPTTRWMRFNPARPLMLLRT